DFLAFIFPEIFDRRWPWRSGALPPAGQRLLARRRLLWPERQDLVIVICHFGPIRNHGVCVLLNPKSLCVRTAGFQATPVSRLICGLRMLMLASASRRPRHGGKAQQAQRCERQADVPSLNAASAGAQVLHHETFAAAHFSQCLLHRSKAAHLIGRERFALPTGPPLELI